MNRLIGGQRKNWRGPKLKQLNPTVLTAFFHPQGLGSCFDELGCTSAAAPLSALDQAAILANNSGQPLTLAQQIQLANGQAVTYPATAPAGTVATQAQTQAGLTALSQLTAAALSNIAKLPGQGGLQPGQTLTVGPNGTYQISAAGTQPGLTLGTALSGSSSLLLLLGVGAVILFMGKK